jgi:hypothetical protein
MLLGANFCWDSGHRLSIRLFVSFLALVGSFLVGLCIGLFLCTYVLNSLERHKKQMYVYMSKTFLLKVELVLPCKWAHLKSVICKNSLGKRYVDGNHTRLGAGAVEPAWQLRDVGVELFYMLHKLRHTEILGFLENARDVAPLLLSSRIVGKHSEKIETITNSSNDLHKNPLGPFLEQPCRSV